MPNETTTAEDPMVGRAKAVARILSDNGHHVTPPDEASLDDVEQARWDTCIEIARALKEFDHGN